MSTAPKRIQRKRTKGWKMPEGAIYVGRPTIWGNPYRVGEPRTGYWPDKRFRTAKQAVDLYGAYLQGLLKAQPAGLIDRLRGKDLACWCPLDQPCHADVLLEIANAE